MKNICIFILLLLHIYIFPQSKDNLTILPENDVTYFEELENIYKKKYLYTQPDSAFIIAQMQLDFAIKKNNAYLQSLAFYNKALVLYHQGEYTQIHQYIQQGLDQINNYNYDDNYKKNQHSKAMLYMLMGRTYYEQANYIASVEYYEKSMKIGKDINDILLQIKCNNNIGLVNFDLGNYPQALEYYQKTLKLNEETQNKRLKAIVYNNIGEVFYDLENYHKALFNYKKCLNIAIELNNQIIMAGSYNNIGNAYYKQKEFQLAIEYCEKGLALNQKLGDKKTMAESYNYLGDIYYELKEYEKALEYHKQSLNLRETLGYQQGIADSYYDFGRLSLIKQKYVSAAKWCEKGLNLALKESAIPLAENCSKCLYDVHKKLNHHKKALVYHEQFQLFKAQLVNEERTKKIAQLELQYEHEKEKTILEKRRNEAILEAQEATLQAEIEQKQKNEVLLQAQIEKGRIWFLGLMIISVLIAISLLSSFLLTSSNNKKLNSKNKELDQQKKLIEKHLRLLKQKNEELKQYIESNMSLQKFAAIVSHDLKAPLRGIKSFSDILNKQLKNEKSVLAKDCLGFITENTVKMEALIDGVLDYSKIDSKAEKETLSLNKLIDDIANDFMASAKDNSILISREELPDIQGNPTQIRQLFQNLIGNGIKYNDKEIKKIHVSSKSLEGNFQFLIKDNGIGISPKYHKKIFDMFRRLHGDSEYKGSGIGLATCQKIVEQHHGKLWVESEEGNGSSFYFTISNVQAKSLVSILESTHQKQVS